MRNGLFQESRATNCQETEELPRICCEETDRARQLRIDELSMHQERNPTTMIQLLTQIQDLQNKLNSLSDTKEFMILKQRAARERPTLTGNPRLFRIPEQSFAAILDSA